MCAVVYMQLFLNNCYYGTSSSAFNSTIRVYEYGYKRTDDRCKSQQRLAQKGRCATTCMTTTTTTLNECIYTIVPDAQLLAMFTRLAKQNARKKRTHKTQHGTVRGRVNLKVVQFVAELAGSQEPSAHHVCNRGACASVRQFSVHVRNDVRLSGHMYICIR